MNPILALFIANPKILNDIVGFDVHNFYHSGNNNSEIVFWERLPFDEIGKTKTLKTEKITRECLSSIAKIQREVQNNN